MEKNKRRQYQTTSVPNPDPDPFGYPEKFVDPAKIRTDTKIMDPWTPIVRTTKFCHCFRRATRRARACILPHEQGLNRCEGVVENGIIILSSEWFSYFLPNPNVKATLGIWKVVSLKTAAHWF